MADAKKITAFGLGRIVFTPGVLEVAREEGVDLLLLLGRHARLDWGDVGAEDALANDDAVAEGSRIFSAYRLKSGAKVWIITEADRSSTCLLLPEEY